MLIHPSQFTTKFPSKFLSQAARAKKEQAEKIEEATKQRKNRFSSSITSNDLINKVLAVTLDEKYENDYFNIFYPASKAQKNNAVSATSYYDIIAYASQLSFATNSILTALRIIYNRISSTPTYDYVQLQQYMDSLINSISIAGNNKFTDDAIKTFMANCSSGTHHIIQPSKVYPGGFDITYSGFPISSRLTPQVSNLLSLTTNVSENTWIGANPKSLSNGDVHLSTALGKDIIDLADELLKRLLNKSITFNDAQQRFFNTLPLTLDATKIFDLSFPNGATFSNKFKISPLPKTQLEVLKKYFSLTVIRNPEPGLAQEHYVNTLVPANEKKVVDNLALLTMSALRLQPDISFTFSIHLPKEIVHFITQTPMNENPSLAALNTWVSIWSRGFLRPLGTRDGGRIRRNMIPRYIIQPSKTDLLQKVRKDLNYYSEEGRSNSDDVFISSNGRFNYLPKSSQLNLSNAKGLEKTLNTAFQLSYDMGVPYSSTEDGRFSSPSILISQEGNLQKAEELKKVRKEVKSYAGSLQTFSWDFNTILVSEMDNPERLRPLSLVGATVPDELAIADYLGFNLGTERSPVVKSFSKSFTMMFPNASIGPEGKRQALTEDNLVLSEFDQINIFSQLFTFYDHLFAKGKVPDFDHLLEEATKEMGYTNLIDDPKASFDYKIYNDVINANTLAPMAQFKELDHPSVAIKLVLKRAIEAANGSRRTAMTEEVSQKFGQSRTEYEEGLNSHPNHFTTHNTMADFSKVYNWLGGKIFFIMLNHLLDLDPAVICEINPADAADFSLTKKPPFERISRDIMPLVYFLGKYVPMHSEIFNKAQVIKDNNKQDTSLTVSDIKIPGTVDGAQMFPHQVKTHQFLRNKPKFAVLDISPGGGKTALGLTDAMCLVKDIEEQKADIKGEKLRPLIVCPDGLVKNWCDDLTKFVGSNWNVVPITTVLFNLWGPERLEEIITKAPINTIFVSGYNFMRAKMFQIVIGTSVSRVSGALEFIRKFGFNYILLDESHRVKNSNPRSPSQRHLTIKQLCTSSNVRYVRLASGTVISNRVVDIVGQAAMFGAHIFRTPDEFEEEINETVWDEDLQRNITRPVKDWPQRARNRLAMYASVITMKKKEWAFMLPIPIVQLYAVPMVEDKDRHGNPLSSEEEALQRTHMDAYNILLEQTIEALTEGLDKAKRKGKQLEEDGDDDDDGDDDSETANGGVGDLGLDDEDELGNVEQQLKYYLQKLEVMLTDPIGDPADKDDGDPLARPMLEKIPGWENYASPKVKKCISLIENHFQENPWKKDSTYKELDMVDYKDKQYIARKQDKSNPQEKAFISVLSPEKDGDTWKQESRGKVIVFCQYVRTVHAIFRALPAHLKKIARPFVASAKESKNNLLDFMTNPGVQILIAVEKAINEGYNMQMASRIVRMESPWAPGELEQASSRIFRPDPAAMKNMTEDEKGNLKPGELRRDVIYLDWVLTNGSIEVAKLGRLIWKMVDNAKFDEANNPDYAAIHPIELTPIRMQIDLLRMNPTLSVFSDYIDSWGTLKSIQDAEMYQMRKSTISKMEDLEKSPVLPGFKKIEFVPYVIDQNVADRDNLGLIKVKDFVMEDKNSGFRHTPDLLKGMFAHTQFGNGEIIRVTPRYEIDEKGNKRIVSSNPISQVWVRLVSGLDGVEEVYKDDPRRVFIATNVTGENIKQFATNKKWTTEGERKRFMRDEEKRLKLLAAEEEKKRALLKKELDKAAKIKKSQQKKTAVIEISVYPVIYNSMLAIEAVTPEPEEKILEEHGFQKFGDYAYLFIRNLREYDKVMDFIFGSTETKQKGFALSEKVENALNSFYSSFESGAGKKFALNLAPVSEVTNFFQQQHRLAGKGELKIYPVVLHNRLMLTVDLATNPRFTKYIGQPVVGAPALKWKKADGIEIFFVPATVSNRKQALWDKVVELEDAGFVVPNRNDAKAELKALDLKQHAVKKSTRSRK